MRHELVFWLWVTGVSLAVFTMAPGVVALLWGYIPGEAFDGYRWIVAIIAGLVMLNLVALGLLSLFEGKKP